MFEGYTKVSKEQFYATVGRLNVHPWPERHLTTWNGVQDRVTYGYSTPGYLCKGEKAFYAKNSLIKDQQKVER